MPDARLRASRVGAQAHDVIVDVRGVEKNYHGLRPLRVSSLLVHAGESVALLGFDQAAAEVLVNLLTAATIPDQGEIRTFGRLTTTIQDADTWLASLDRFGILSERAVVIDQMTVEDNLTMPLTMALHDVDRLVREKVMAIAAEVGLDAARMTQPIAALGPTERARLRLGRALGPDPGLLLAEHPNAMVAPADVDRFAADYARIVRARGLTSLVLTADPDFAAAVATRVLTLQPATGEFTSPSRWRRLFTRRP